MHQAAVEEEDIPRREVHRLGGETGGTGTYSRVNERSGSASSGQKRSILWVPGTTSSPPFSRSAGSRATQAAMQVPGSTLR